MRAALAAIVLCVLANVAGARDLGQWEDNSPEVRAWFKGLMQPDNPRASCCGDADAYYADSFAVEGDHYVAIITDERDDVRTLPDGSIVHRPHIDPGTRVPVPNAKMKWDAGNPTGHGVLFVGPYGVYCYVAPGGV